MTWMTPRRTRLRWVLLLGIAVLTSTWAFRRRQPDDGILSAYRRSEASARFLDDTRFSVIMLSYNRSTLLKHNIASMAASQAVPSLAEIIVVWPAAKEQGLPPLDFVDPRWVVPVRFVVREDNLLSNRFAHLADISTRCVLVRDDDLSIAPQDVEFGFQVWRLHQYQMVGFTPRMHHFNVETARWEYDWDLTNKYSMVLTNIAYLHVSFLDAYWAPSIAHLRKLVDDGFNCEDILMNFAAVRSTRQPPVLIRAPSGSIVHWKKPGISTKPGHKERRDSCMDTFIEYFGEDGLLVNDMVVSHLLDHTKVDEMAEFEEQD